MAEITFSAREKAELVQKVKTYFDQELQQDIGGFEAEFLIDFFGKEIGAYFYNRGLHDAKALLEAKLEEFGDAIYEIEKPTT